MPHRRIDMTNADAILVGGGLANVLIALKLRAERPGTHVLVLEQGPSLGANHTWSFHDTDLTPEQLAWVEPLVIASWPRQEVRFPTGRRVLETGYKSISSERLHDVAMEILGPSVRLNCAVSDVGRETVTLADGTVMRVPLVIDGRGALQQQPLALGYQKFVGVEIETATPHGLAHPIIMDATVPQTDGYRFVYSLPFSATRMLIEDTYYSDTPDLDPQQLGAGVEAYAVAQGWNAAKIVRREAGVLPITLAGDIDQHWRTMGQEIPRSGLRAWLFHATTGYSFPNAVRLAEEIAHAPNLSSEAIAKLVEARSRETWKTQAIFRLLNRSMFLAADPAGRVRILDRFYSRLPTASIERFYAGSLRKTDIVMLMAIMARKPPVNIGRAIACLSEASSWKFASKQRASKAQLG
jgi:lycopene beta-cyclase